MRTVASRSASPQSSPAQRRAGARAPSATPASPYASRPVPLIQAKCACGGGCPSCEDKRKRFQTKLAVSTPGDMYEREADAVASRILQVDEPQVQRATPSITPLVQRVERNADEEDNQQAGVVQMAYDHGASGPHVDAAASDITSLSGGRAMPAADRSFFGRRFGRDFSAVRIHSGPRAARLARSVNALAFTFGRDIVFRDSAGPASPEARGLLAHELVHVAQQGRAPPQARSQPSPAELTHGGEPLPASLQTFFEPRFGRDLSGVRIHRGTDADGRTARLDAYAFAYDNHIWLSAGVPLARNFVLAHELAHVVQQHQPPRLRTGADTPSPSFAQKSVQRQTSFWFWAVVGKTGDDMHDEILHDTARPSDFLVEPGIPNANSNGQVGFDARWGFPDWYKSEPAPAIGVHFKRDPMSSTPCGSEMRGKPGGLNTAIAGAQPQPGGANGVTGEAAAPKDVWLGELKPANADIVQMGEGQLNLYERGIRFAVEQTNCRVPAPGWQMDPIQRADETSLPIPAGYRFSHTGPWNTDRMLELTRMDFAERTGKRLRPYGTRGFPGGLYAIHVRNGVVAYFARPERAELIRIFRRWGAGTEMGAAADEATRIQNQVVAPLMTPPQPVNMMLRRNRMPAGQALRVTPDNSRTIRRKRKPRKVNKLEDRFSLSSWQDKQTRATTHFQKQKDQPLFQNLEFLNGVYEAEKALPSTAQGKGSEALPPKSELEVEIRTPKTGDGARARKKKMSLVDVFDFVELWTGPEVRILGPAREKFGGTFVSVATAVGNLKQKLADKLDSTRAKSDRGGGSYGALAIRAFWRASKGILGILFSDTLAVLVDSLVSGLRTTLEALFDIDVDELRTKAEQGFPEIHAAVELVQGLVESIEEQVGSVLAELEEFFSKLVAIADGAKVLGYVIKAAMIAFQCGTPPGWGCLKLIASELIRKATDEILSWCSVQKEIAGWALDTGFFDDVPTTVAGKIADLTERLLPATLVPVFDRSLFDTVKPVKSADVPCETGKELDIALAKLHGKLEQQLGESGLMALDIARMKYGIRDDRKLTADEVNEILEGIPDVTAEELWDYVGTTEPPDPKTAKKVDIAEFLQHVKKKAEAARTGDGAAGGGLTGPGGLPTVHAPSAEIPKSPGGGLIPDLLFRVVAEPWHVPLAGLDEPRTIAVTVIVERDDKDLFAVLEVPVQVASVKTRPAKSNGGKPLHIVRYKLMKYIYLGPEMDVTMVGKDGMLHGSFRE